MPIVLEELFTKLLNLPPLEVTLAEVREREIILHCCSVLGQAHCLVCLEKCNFVKDTYVRKLRDLSISGKKVLLHFTVRQFVCQDCNRHFHEQYPFAAKNGTMTQRYEDFIYFRCQGADLRYVCLQEDIGWRTVRDIFHRQAQKEVCSRALFSSVTHIGIDEIALKKGHRNFVAVLVNLQTGQVMDILPERSKVFLKSYFLGKGKAFCEQIVCFCSDMWEGYLNCAREVFPNATIVADRFHFFAYLNQEVDKCRRSLRRKYPKDEELKHLKWTLLRPREDLAQDTLEALESILDKPEYALLKRTWQARNEFRDMLETHSTWQEAEALIEAWQQRHTQQPNRFVQRFVDFYQKWKSYILNYFTYRQTTSLIEGINNKLKLIKRKAFGFLTFEAFRLRAIIEF
jgi:transposase